MNKKVSELLEQLPPDIADAVRPHRGMQRRECLTCSNVFETSSTRRIFCSGKCRQAYHRVKRALERYLREQGSKSADDGGHDDSGPAREPETPGT